MKIFLVISLIGVFFFNPACGGDRSKMPKQMPPGIEITFNAKFGMSRAFKKISLKSGELIFDACDTAPAGGACQTVHRTARIDDAELAKLYTVFVENSFDTIQTDKAAKVVDDAPFESIFISLNAAGSYQQSYGDNQPMSGNNLKRYQRVRDAIVNLAARLTDQKTTDFSDENQQIFEFNEGELASYLGNVKPAKLSGEDLAAMDEVLQKGVADANAKETGQSRQIGSLSGYRRQLIPYLNAKGEKEIWLNFFCSANGVDWRKVIVMVDGGGSCYFTVKINLVNKIAYDLSINGAF